MVWCLVAPPEVSVSDVELKPLTQLVKQSSQVPDVCQVSDE